MCLTLILLCIDPKIGSLRKAGQCEPLWILILSIHSLLIFSLSKIFLALFFFFWWHLLGRQPWQDETEYLLPSHWLSETAGDNEQKPLSIKPWPQKWLLVLWVRSGRAVWSKSVVGMTNRLFVCLFMTHGILTHSSVCSQITDIFVIDQGERPGERKCKSIHGCIVVVLNLLL